jgi:hypothetical protein
MISGLYRVWLRPSRKAISEMDPNEVLKQTEMKEFMSREEAEKFIAATCVKDGWQIARDYPNESMLWEDA